ncbi:MAG: hypothetical protein AB7P01_06070 [Bacteroidia bacterium]
MLRLTCSLTLGNLLFPYVVSVEHEATWQRLTDTCTIELPRKLYDREFKNRALKDMLKIGGKVNIELGYNDRNDTVFSGFIRQVNPIIPVKIACEDAMWNLKQNNVTHQFPPGTKLKTIIEHIAPGVPNKVLDVDIGKYTIPEEWSAAKVLEDLKSSWGLQSFFRDGKLQVGLQYDPDYAVTKPFNFEQNIISHSLEFFTKENIRLNVEAISIGKDNKKTTVQVGDERGEKRTMHFYNLSTTELKAAAERELSRLKYDGYRGSFTTFGKPFVRHGDIVQLTDPTYDRSGKYWVDKVVRKFGTGGYRQEITLGAAV